MTTVKKFLTKYRYLIVLTGIFCCHLFFRFYNLEKWASFNWDQVDNAWASAKILIYHKYPLIGMEAKRNSGFYIGPFYYYLTAIFYAFTKLNPIASPILAAVTSLFSVSAIYFITKKLFNNTIAIWAFGIYVFSSNIIRAERSQWPVNFIPSLSLIILYLLHRILNGKQHFLLFLSICIGLFFHLHFTAIFYPILTLLSFPFIKLDGKTVKYALISISILLIFFIPQFLYYINSNHGREVSKYSEYIQANFHGIHGKRIMQIAADAFIKFQSVIETPYKPLRPLIFFYLPVFIIFYLLRDISKYKLTLCYLIVLWFIVPWIIFSTYRGEISDYYFSSTLYVAVIIFAWFSDVLWKRNIFVFRCLLIVFWGYYAISNVQSFFNTANEQTFRKNMTRAEVVANVNQYLNFTEGDPQSYMYFYQMYKQKKPLPYKL